jgi:hypothetical protein
MPSTQILTNFTGTGISTALNVTGYNAVIISIIGTDTFGAVPQGLFGNSGYQVLQQYLFDIKAGTFVINFSMTNRLYLWATFGTTSFNLNVYSNAGTINAYAAGIYHPIPPISP